jgi:5'-methylthioadenosine phosphorylase
VHRHGPGHSLPPHAIRHEANIFALKSLGIQCIVGLNAVGSLTVQLPPGAIVALTDLVAAHTRPPALADLRVAHADMTQPYCPRIHQHLCAALKHRSDFHPSGTMVGVMGPRFETPAEVALYASWGAHVVGMTGVPEAVAAKEARMCYAALACVTNFGVGLTDRSVAHDSVVAVMETVVNGLRSDLLDAIQSLGDQADCRSNKLSHGCCSHSD